MKEKKIKGFRTTSLKYSPPRGRNATTRRARCPNCRVPPQARAANSSSSRPNAHFHYQSHEEDQHLVSELEDYLMQGKLSLTMPVHFFAANPRIHKNIIDKPKARRVETNEYEADPPQIAFHPWPDLLQPPQSTMMPPAIIRTIRSPTNDRPPSAFSCKS